MEMTSYTMDIRFIIYAMLCTILDVSYALSITSRYQSNTHESHWKIVKNVLKHLRRIKKAIRFIEEMN